jgi:hypothetical protein
MDFFYFLRTYVSLNGLRGYARTWEYGRNGSVHAHFGKTALLRGLTNGENGRGVSFEKAFSKGRASQ